MTAPVTAESVVKRYIELRDFMEAEKKTFNARMLPYQQAMEGLENWAELQLQETKQTALTTEFGTAFRVNKSRVTVDDHGAFLDFIWSTGQRGFLTKHVSKDAVEVWMEANEGKLPPGVKYSGFTVVQFRRA